MCNYPATAAQVNQHLDNGCPVQPDTTSNNFENETVPSAAVKNETEDPFSDSDTDLADLDVDAKSPGAKLRASRSVSNQPNKFGGVESICYQGREVEFRPSPNAKRSMRSPPFKQQRRSTTPSSSAKKRSGAGEGVGDEAITSPVKAAKKALNFETSNHVPLTQGPLIANFIPSSSENSQGNCTGCHIYLAP